MKRLFLAAAVVGISVASGSVHAWPGGDRAESRSDFMEKASAYIQNPADIPGLRDKADGGDKQSAYVVSRLFNYGVYYDKDFEKALEYAIQAEGLSDEAYLWSLKLRSKAGEVSVDHWHDAASKGVPEALYQLSNHYFHEGPDQDYDLGWFFLSQAVSKGHEEAKETYLKKTAQARSVPGINERRTEARSGSFEGLEQLSEAYGQGINTEDRQEKAQRLQYVLDRLGY